MTLAVDGSMDMTDRALAAAFVGGSQPAFDALYGRYAAPIHDYLRWTVKDASAAEDLAQSTFLQAWERRASLRDPEAVRGWLYRIAHNIAMNHVTRGVRAEALDEEAPIESGTAGPEELAGSAEAAELVWDAAASLEPRQFAVLDLSVRKGLTTAEIAEVLGLDVPAASLAVHRAREALGNAVRYLLVARRRRHCDRLAELVPEGVRRLTPQQRATVDRHMRRCADCQRTSTMLTAPEQLFALVPLIALPTRLNQSPLAASQAAQGVQRAANATRATRAARAPQILHSTVGLGGVAVVAIAAVIAGIVLLRPGGARNTAPSTAAIKSPAVSAPGDSATAVSGGPLPGQIVFRAGRAQGVAQPYGEMNPDGTDVRQLSISGLLCCSVSGLSPDGTKLLIVGEGAIGLMVGGTDGPMLKSSPGGSFFEPTWSPSGDEIAYVFTGRPGEIDIIDASGTTERRVVQSLEVGTAGGLAWSPDGTQLAFVGSSGVIDLVNVSGGAIHTLLRPLAGTAGTVTGLSWAPGPAVLFATSLGPGLQEIEPDRAGLRTILPGAGYSSPSWAPDGIHIVTIRGGRMSVATVDGVVQASVGPEGVDYAQWGGPATPPTAPASSPALGDGRYFGFIKSIDPGTRSLVFDRAEFLTGDAAQKAAEADGVKGPVANYYIRHNDTVLHTLTVGNDVSILIAPDDFVPDGPLVPGELGPFAAVFSAKDVPPPGSTYHGSFGKYWLTILGGLVVRIEEQWLP